MTTDTSLISAAPSPFNYLFNSPGTPLNKLVLSGIQAHNIENAQIFGYEFTLGGRGQIGPVGIQVSAGYSYNFGSALPVKGDTSDHYTTANFFSDAFKYNVQRVSDTTSATYHHLLA
jgi:hypothetical protein